MTATPAPKTAEEKPAVRKPARRARLRRRHRVMISTFCLLVLFPVLLVGWYLEAWATPQYSSSMSFSIRSEELSNPLDMLSGLGELSSGTTSDAQIIYDFVQSQQIVRTIDAELGLRALYSAPENDPVFTIASDVPVEKLVRHWKRMVQANLDKGSGLVRVQSFAFAPEDAQRINRAILRQSQSLVDELSLLAREDAIKYAADDLQQARERLKEARQELSTFRSTSRIIDPTIEVQAEGGVSAALQQQLAEAWIELDLIVGSTSGEDDPRLQQLRRRVAAIEGRLEQQRQQLAGQAGSDMVEIVGRFEALLVEREFAEQAFVAAAAAFDSARAEAGRRTKYLAVHIEPTLADAALYPRGWLIVPVVFAMLFLGWAVLVMVAYSIRDRG